MHQDVPKPLLVLIKSPDRVHGTQIEGSTRCGARDAAGILLAGGKIVGLLSDEQVNLAEKLCVEVYDARGCLAMPGLVDLHVHITGGGGEAGPASRAPESQLSAFLDAGITTVVGLLGTDCCTRRQANLVAKCRALNEEGITAYHWAGSYRVPPATITGSIQEDMCIIESCVGVGEIAVSDHRSSCPTPHELARIASEARVGGMLSGKAGLVHVHMGTGAAKLQPLLDAVAMSDVPISQFLPTHMERNPKLVAAGIEWMVVHEGFADFTAGAQARAAFWQIRAEAELQDSEAEMFDALNGLLQRCTVSSDSFGSLPVFDKAGKLVEYTVADPKEMLNCLRQLHFEDKFCLEDVVALFTRQPAARLKLSNKGEIAPGRDADILLLDSNTLELRNVFAKGELVRTPEWTRGGLFERGPRIRPRTI